MQSKYLSVLVLQSLCYTVKADVRTSADSQADAKTEKVWFLAVSPTYTCTISTCV